jgi:hypothetical protein|nr:glycohydrolase toxin TNT-related protein [Clostridia bacterium]
MNQLKEMIQFLLKSGTEDILQLVSAAQKLYLSVSRLDRADNLIPENASSLNSTKPVICSSTGEYRFQYEWNKGENSEFDGDIQEGAVVAPGQFVDRIGSAEGRYVSPVPSTRDVYSVEERALPYFLIEDKITEEPAYHVYEVLREINTAAVIEAIDNSNGIFPDAAAKEFAKVKVKSGDIAFGRVAAVSAFGSQGQGGGDQYRLNIDVHYLVALKFFEEVRA